MTTSCLCCDRASAATAGWHRWPTAKAQLVTLSAFLMLAVITVAIGTFTAIVSVWPGPPLPSQSGSGRMTLLWSFGSGAIQRTSSTCLRFSVTFSCVTCTVLP